MTRRRFLVRARLAATVLLLLVLGVPLAAQFRDDFDKPLVKDPTGARGWGFVTGEGRAVMDILPGPGYLTVAVDATKDRRGVWWAFIIRQVQGSLDLAKLRTPGHELRIEARLRTDTAPRWVNLHLNTQRTTDFHSHLMEYDLAEAGTWYTISMTTRGFDAGPGDTVNAQMALMDWGLGRYRVDVDYIKVDVVEAAQAPPDLGPPIPYHPPVADPATFAEVVPVAADLTVDLNEPGVNLNDWTEADAGGRAAVVSVGGTRLALLRWDFGRFAGKKIAGPGLLELTTRTLGRPAADHPDFALLRVVEILGGEPGWDERTATWTEISRRAPRELVINPQMIIDWPATAGDGGKTYLTIPPVVLQRLIDGKTLGIALTPLGSIEASFYSREERGGSLAARLLFNLQKATPGHNDKLFYRYPSRGGEGICLEDPRPWRGDRQGAEGEAYRSDHQRRDGATRRSASEKYLRKALFSDFSQKSPPCISGDFCPPLTFVRFGRMAGEQEAIPEQSRREGRRD